MKINRDTLLKELRKVEGGLAIKATVEQSDCFVFNKGMVMTYNDQVACSTKCCLSITGAIKAKTMLSTLSTWPFETIQFKMKEGGLAFKGKDAQGILRVEKEIRLPIKDVETPKKWKKLPEEFQEAIELVGGCASKNSASPHLCCIHFASDKMEACDGVQAGRFALSLPFKTSILIQKDSIRCVYDKSIMESGPSAVSETKNWVHFKDKHGLLVSCHKHFDDYPTDELTKVFATKGNPAVLPKELKGLVRRLDYYLNDTTASQWLIVRVDSKHIKVTGSGRDGKQTVRTKIKYKGEPIAFNINPNLLQELGRKHDKCQIAKNFIKIKKNKFQYVTSLWVPSEKEEEE